MLVGIRTIVIGRDIFGMQLGGDEEEEGDGQEEEREGEERKAERKRTD